MTFPCELHTSDLRAAQPCVYKEYTLNESVAFSGHALFTGQSVNVRICPAKAGQGIVFQRTDLPHRPLIPAHLNALQNASRSTILGKGNIIIQTVEHLLAALSGCGVDNATIEISGPEVPIFDGSAQFFCELLEKVGVKELEQCDAPQKLLTPVYWSEGDVHLIALPSDVYRISYTLHYPHSRFLRSQYHSTVINEEIFKKEIAPCRTFCLYEEVAAMIEKGLLKGSGLENGVIIKDDQVMNPDGLRFDDEMARHKILDIVGDLSLIPGRFLAHIIAIRAGHASNLAFAKQLFNRLTIEKGRNDA